MQLKFFYLAQCKGSNAEIIHWQVPQRVVVALALLVVDITRAIHCIGIGVFLNCVRHQRERQVKQAKQRYNDGKGNNKTSVFHGFILN